MSAAAFRILLISAVVSASLTLGYTFGRDDTRRQFSDLLTDANQEHADARKCSELRCSMGFPTWSRSPESGIGECLCVVIAGEVRQ